MAVYKAFTVAALRLACGERTTRYAMAGIMADDKGLTTTDGKALFHRAWPTSGPEWLAREQCPSGRTLDPDKLPTVKARQAPTTKAKPSLVQALDLTALATAPMIEGHFPPYDSVLPSPETLKRSDRYWIVPT